MHRRAHIMLLALAVSVWALGGCGMSTCVSEGTLIDTPHGMKPIETLVKGDCVWSVDEHGERKIGVITATHSGRAHDLMEITTPVRSLTCTADHLVQSRVGWCRVSDIADSGSVQTTDGTEEVRTRRIRAGSIRVYDLSVHPHQTYFANGVVVHNKTMALPAKAEDLHGTWIVRGRNGRWYRFHLLPDGQGKAEFATFDWADRQFKPTSVDFVSWKLSGFDFEMRVRQESGDIQVMRGQVHESVKFYEMFVVDGMTMERPQRLFKELDAIGVTHEPQR